MKNFLRYVWRSPDMLLFAVFAIMSIAYVSICGSKADFLPIAAFFPIGIIIYRLVALFRGYTEAKGK